MSKSKIKFFETGGSEHTDETLSLALSKAKEEDINYIVAASGGTTLLKAAKSLKKERMEDIKLIGMTLHAGTWPKYSEPDWNKIEEAQKLGAQVLTCTHALMGNVETAIKDSFGGLPPVELIARTYYTFSQGTKVAVEIALNAVDAGLIPAGEKTIAVGGSGRGADTALMLKAVSSVDFFDLNIIELICMPRED